MKKPLLSLIIILASVISGAQTIINRDLVNNLKFYNGGFPASLGDKMSSVLQVDYDFEKEANFGGVVRGSLLNLGAALWAPIPEN